MRGIQMKAALTVLKEQINNFYLIRRLSVYELLSKNRNNYLGTAWEMINPTIQLIIYCVVFSTIRSREPVEVGGVDIHFFAWLVAGFGIWIVGFELVIDGSISLYIYLRMLSKMNFPMSVIPNFVIFSNLYVHLAVLSLSIIVLQFMGYYVNVYYFQFIYFIISAICLLFAISLVTSTLSTILRDFH